MDKPTLNKQRFTFRVIGHCQREEDLNQLLVQLMQSGLMVEDVEYHACYENWLCNLPEALAPGLREACLDYFSPWGKFKGDYMAKCCVLHALRSLDCDLPKEVAATIYESVANYRMSNFDAVALTIDIMNHSLTQLQEPLAA